MTPFRRATASTTFPRWIWLFVDVPAPAAGAWDFWRTVTRTDLSGLRGEHDQFTTLVPAHGDPWVKLQEVGAGGGVHLDIDVDDVAAAARLATGLGADEVQRFPEGTVVVMRSPGGFLFCLTQWHGEKDQRRDGEPDLLDQVCLDAPADRFDAEVAFWSGLLGLTAVPGRGPQFVALERPERLPVRILLQRTEDHYGRVRGHLDLACADRAVTRAAHEAGGASHVREGETWSVMADPAGHHYCLTDRNPRTGLL